MKEPVQSNILPTLAAFIGAGCLTFALVELEAFEFIYEFSREHESWQLDEIFMVLVMTLIIGLATLAINLSRALARTRAAYGKLAMSHDRLVKMQNSALKGHSVPAAAEAKEPHNVR